MMSTEPLISVAPTRDTLNSVSIEPEEEEAKATLLKSTLPEPAQPVGIAAEGDTLLDDGTIRRGREIELESELGPVTAHVFPGEADESAESLDPCYVPTGFHA
jgi:hypothetical protein